MKLTEAERDTAVWRKVKEYMEQRLVSYRAMNDGDWNDTETARIRGRIAEMKALLLIDQDDPTFEAEEKS